ncbi:hypothetical protein [Aquirhabdus parva]|uniref:hypothetical protein n=1 Tax=Aquirhabdus parva TaxID=2283318 RepID=UPI0013B37F94|nr:hypothetical protein [Aquirhabdus parva]
MAAIETPKALKDIEEKEALKKYGRNTLGYITELHPITGKYPCDSQAVVAYTAASQTFQNTIEGCGVKTGEVTLGQSAQVTYIENNPSVSYASVPYANTWRYTWFHLIGLWFVFLLLSFCSYWRLKNHYYINKLLDEQSRSGA